MNKEMIKEYIGKTMPQFIGRFGREEELFAYRGKLRIGDFAFVIVIGDIEDEQEDEQENWQEDKVQLVTKTQYAYDGSKWLIVSVEEFYKNKSDIEICGCENNELYSKRPVDSSSCKRERQAL